MKRSLVKIGVGGVGMERGTNILTRFLLWSDNSAFYRLKK